MHEFLRLKRLPPYVFNITSELKAAARARGEDIIDFGMGNPDGATPKHIVDKMIEAAGNTATHRYSLSKGIPRLRKAICNWYQKRYDVQLDPLTEAIVTIGSKEGIAHLCLATLDRGDVVAVPSPSYPIHIYGPVIAGANVRGIPVHSTDEFLAELEQSVPLMYPRPKMLILNFPGESHHAMCGSGIFRACGRLMQRIPNLPGARSCLCGYRFRWISSAIDPAGTGSERYRG